ncbi:choice-of-anchor I family protein [Verrucomicrobiaceae bacterium 227]
MINISNQWRALSLSALVCLTSVQAQSTAPDLQGSVSDKDTLIYGSSAVFLEGRHNAVRTEETNLGNLTADANLAAARALDPTVVISFKNGGQIHAGIGAIDEETGEAGPTLENPLSGKAAGEISQLDIENSLPSNHELTLLTLGMEEIVALLEDAVSTIDDDSASDQFPQIGGLAFSFDPELPSGERVQTVALKNTLNETIELLVENGEMLVAPTRSFRVVTLAGGAASFSELAEDVLETGLGEQQALADFLLANHSETPFTQQETGNGQDARIQNLKFRSDSVAYPQVPPAEAISLKILSRYETGIYDASAAEITAFDPESQHVFLVNARDATVEILDLSNPENPAFVSSLDVQSLLGRRGEVLSPNSVAVADGIVAVAIARNRDNEINRPLNGYVAYFDVDGTYLTCSMVGYGPDMVTFTPDQNSILVANEGEPSSDYLYDPEGSVSVLPLSLLKWQLRYQHSHRPWWLPRRQFIFPPLARTASFHKFNRREHQLVASGVRIYGPGANVAQDLEPEFIAVSDDSRTAYVTLQENNAIAVVDIRSAKVRSIEPLGLKDFTLSGFDASNKDDSINIQPWPVLGMYQPDALAQFESGGKRYLVTSNEGDARDYDGFSEEVRLADLSLDPEAFPDAELLLTSGALGRLRVTDQNGDLDGDGDLDQIFAYGARSFSVWEVQGGHLQQVYDSGADLENITASLVPAEFNSSNDENDSFDSRSDDKGPEPEGVTVGEVNGRTYAFIGLERIGGVMVYDITHPEAPFYVQYLVTRDFFGDAEEGTAGDLGPEGLEFIPADESPNGRPLLLVANEVSGSLTIIEIE